MSFCRAVVACLVRVASKRARPSRAAQADRRRRRRWRRHLSRTPPPHPRQQPGRQGHRGHAQTTRLTYSTERDTAQQRIMVCARTAACSPGPYRACTPPHVLLLVRFAAGCDLIRSSPRGAAVLPVMSCACRSRPTLPPTTHSRRTSSALTRRSMTSCSTSRPVSSRVSSSSRLRSAPRRIVQTPRGDCVCGSPLCGDTVLIRCAGLPPSALFLLLP